MYYCTNPEKFESEDLHNDDYFVSSFYDIYTLIQENIKKPYQMVLKRYTPEEDYMVHRLLKMYIVYENMYDKVIIIDLQK